MRKLLTILFLTSSILLCGQKYKVMVPPLPTVVSAEGGSGWTNLLAYYDCDESVGDGTLNDLEGSDDGVVTNAVQGNAGKLGNCITMDGSGDWVTLGTGQLFDYEDFTVCFWIKTATSSGMGVLGGDALALSYIIHSSFRPRVLEEGSSGSPVPSIAISDDVWTFVSVSRTGTTIKFGINGVYEVETVLLDLSGAMNTIGETAMGTDLSGSIDEIAIFSDVKSEAYLTAMYNSGTGITYEDGDPL